MGAYKDACIRRAHRDVAAYWYVGTSAKNRAPKTVRRVSDLVKTAVSTANAISHVGNLARHARNDVSGVAGISNVRDDVPNRAIVRSVKNHARKF